MRRGRGGDACSRRRGRRKNQKRPSSAPSGKAKAPLIRPFGAPSPRGRGEGSIRDGKPGVRRRQRRFVACPLPVARCGAILRRNRYRPPDPPVIRTAFFLIRMLAAWAVVFFFAALLWSSIPFVGHWELPILLACLVTAGFVITSVFAHVDRVRLIAGKIDRESLGNRQGRRIEIPFEAGEAFDLLDAAIRELPNIEEVE